MADFEQMQPVAPKLEFGADTGSAMPVIDAEGQVVSPVMTEGAGEAATERVAGEAVVAVQIDVDGEKLSQNKNSARVENYYAFCEVVSEDNIGEGVVINADPNTNLLYPMTRIPAVCYHIKQGKTVIKTKVIAEFSKK